MTTPDNLDMSARIAAAAAAEAAGKPAPTPGEKADIPPQAAADTPPQKRGRGRPPKNKDAASVQAQINASATKEAPKAAKAKKTAAAAVDLDANKLGGQLIGLHMIIAKLTGMPFMMLSEKEGYALAESVIGVAEQYDLTINPRVAAGLQLAATAAMIYGPRAIMFTEAKKAAINAARMRTQTGEATDVSSNQAG